MATVVILGEVCVCGDDGGYVVCVWGGGHSGGCVGGGGVKCGGCSSTG